MSILSIDCWSQIFSYLDAKDLICCTYVSKTLYQASCSNIIWFQLYINEISKILKKKCKIKYEYKNNYKIEYFKLFNQKYRSQFIELYNDSFFQHLIYKTSTLEKLLILPMILIPAYIILFPFGLGIEVFSLVKHFRKKYEYCQCESCHNKLHRNLKNLKIDN